MYRTYSHQLGEEVQSISGWYRLHTEGRISFQGKEFLYVVGDGVVDSSCCGVGGCRYAIVPGRIVRWMSETNEEGVVTSQVEPVSDRRTREELARLISTKEAVTQVQFW